MFVGGDGQVYMNMSIIPEQNNETLKSAPPAQNTNDKNLAIAQTVVAANAAYEDTDKTYYNASDELLGIKVSELKETVAQKSTTGAFEKEYKVRVI